MYSTKEHDESGSCDNEKLYDEKMVLFVKQYHNYIKRNRVKHSDKNLIKFRRRVDSLIHDENKKGKSKSSCFNCGKPEHYKSDCPQLNKDKGKGRYKKSRKTRRAYIAWESDSEISSEDSSSESDEKANLSLTAHHNKKKKVNNSKYEPIDEISHYE